LLPVVVQTDALPIPVGVTGGPGFGESSSLQLWINARPVIRLNEKIDFNTPRAFTV
jgi:hypothetical protein